MNIYTLAEKQNNISLRRLYIDIRKKNSSNRFLIFPSRIFKVEKENKTFDLILCCFSKWEEEFQNENKSAL